MAVCAGWESAKRTPSDALKATEHRLYALPILRERVKHDLDLESSIAADVAEIEKLDRALEACAGDPYYLTVTGRYFENLDDEHIAELLHCDTSTVWRNRKRLVQRISVWLYGAAAVV